MPGYRERPAEVETALVPVADVASSKQEVWLMAEAGVEGVGPGKEVRLEGSVVRAGSRDALLRRAGRWYHVRGCSAEDAPRLGEDIASVCRPPRSRDATPIRSIEPEAEEDSRTLWVDYDMHQERFKDWRSVVKESKEMRWSDFPVDGPCTTLHLMKHMERVGGSPRQWMQEFAREHRLDRGDRVFHELGNLVEVRHLGGCYDQVNMAGLAAFEKVSRRLQVIIDAYSTTQGGGPNWKMAKYYDAAPGSVDGVAPSLRSWGIKKAKEELELSSHRVRAPAADGIDESTGDAAQSGGRGRGRGRGAGRGGGGQSPPAQSG